MKKIIMLTVVTIIIGLIVGCSSVPPHYNMTGTWKCTFTETGKSEAQTGSMVLVQKSYKVTGKSYDSFGEFELLGSISAEDSTFMVDGKRNDGKRSFRLNGSLNSDNEFKGTYTTDENISGTLEATRVTSN
jgi:hypothetical protein